MQRAAGILLHPTSLPGRYGIGDLDCSSWLRFLDSAALGLWQVLPLGPTGYGDSPYQTFSSFAGNPLLISPDLLVADGLLEDIGDIPDFPLVRVDYGPVIDWKTDLLRSAASSFSGRANGELRAAFEAFRESASAWLADYALFVALKNEHGGRAWTDWPEPLRLRDADALTESARRLADQMEATEIIQFLFFHQWGRVKSDAAARGVTIIGDLPIFVAADSADVWANPELFWLGDDGRPTVVAGVPPDYFSATGQLWGNPLYRWDVHEATGFEWWIERLRATLDQVDVVRIDHFRAFADYWEIPASAQTAETGTWRDGPGDAFFTEVQHALGDLPIIAEDLGELSPAVPALRDRWELPGMRILQFGFATDLDDLFLPHNYPERCVAYTGTHDNDTVRGWWESAPVAERRFAAEYLLTDGSDIAWDMIRRLWHSDCAYALAPMQDILRLDSSARMNTPGVAAGNWSWRMRSDATSGEVAAELRALTVEAKRANEG